MKKEDYLKKIEEELNHEIEDFDGKNESKIVNLSTILANFSTIGLMTQTLDISTNVLNNIGNIPISSEQLDAVGDLLKKNKFMG